MECYQRGKELLGRGELEESCRALSDFIETQKRLQVPENWEELVDAFNARGHIKYLWVDFDGAVEDYTEAIRRNPDFAVAYYNRGQIHYRLGKDQFDVVPGEHWVPSLIPRPKQSEHGSLFQYPVWAWCREGGSGDVSGGNMQGVVTYMSLVEAFATGIKIVLDRFILRPLMA